MANDIDSLLELAGIRVEASTLEPVPDDTDLLTLSLMKAIDALREDLAIAKKALQFISDLTNHTAFDTSDTALVCDTYEKTAQAALHLIKN